MLKLLESSNTADLTSTVQVLNLHIYAPKIYWLVVHHVKHIIETKPSGIFNPPYIMGEPNLGVYHRDKRWGDWATLEAVIIFFLPKVTKLRKWGYFEVLNSMLVFICVKNFSKYLIPACFW